MANVALLQWLNSIKDYLPLTKNSPLSCKPSATLSAKRWKTGKSTSKIAFRSFTQHSSDVVSKHALRFLRSAILLRKQLKSPALNVSFQKQEIEFVSPHSKYAFFNSSDSETVFLTREMLVWSQKTTYALYLALRLTRYMAPMHRR